MPTIYIDNQPCQVPDGQNLLHACLALGFDIPYFCWHPAMHSVGACRQCAVKQFKDENDTRGRIVMSCMTPAAEGTRISIDDPEVRAFRKAVIELLMLNHPHDCPVCDEGGECHLQDMTLMTGHDYRQTRFPKRTYRNQDLGPFVTHEMNRCIQCHRCVRFYCDYAGGRDLNVFGWHDRVYFGRQQDGPLESEFSGNLVEVCPTGVFTDKSLASHYTRKWDLQTAPSVCVHCGLGCNTLPGERYGTLRRIRARFNAQVNGYFLCDRGRYGYEFTHSDLRLRKVTCKYSRKTGQGLPAEVEETGQCIPLAPAIAESLRAGRAIGIGSARASLESNFALRQLVGADRFHAGVAARQHGLLRQMLALLYRGPAPAASLKRVELADSVLVLGEDLTNVAPMMDLAVRQAAQRQVAGQAIRSFKLNAWDDAAVREAVQDRRGPVFIAAPAATKLDALATLALRAAPDDLARLAAATAHEIAAAAPAVEGASSELIAHAKQIAAGLLSAELPVVICGPSMGSRALIDAAAGVAWALRARGKDAALAMVVPECNSLGLAMLEPHSIEGVLPALKAGLVDTLIVLENDLYRFLDRQEVDELLAAVRHLIVLDHLHTPTVERAQLSLPAGTFAESDGTLVNHEGRAQRFFQVFPSVSPVKESWRWLTELAAESQRPAEMIKGPAAVGASPAGLARSERVSSLIAWKKLDDVLDAMVKELPALAAVREAAPQADFRIHGQAVPRQLHRYSGRTAMFANRTVVEPPPPPDVDAPMTFSMEGYSQLPPPELIAHYWLPSWNSVQAMNKFQVELGLGLTQYATGKRLIEPSKQAQAQYLHELPQPFQQRPGQWLVVPVCHIYGSEELSAQSPPVASLALRPYVALNGESAAAVGAAEGDPLTVTVGRQTYELLLRVLPSLAAGLAAVYLGVAESSRLAGTWAQIMKAAPAQGGAS